MRTGVDSALILGMRVGNGVQTEGVTKLLQAPGKLACEIPNISGTRNLSDNLSDLKAQVESAGLLLY